MSTVKCTACLEEFEETKLRELLIDKKIVFDRIHTNCSLRQKLKRILNNRGLLDKELQEIMEPTEWYSGCILALIWFSEEQKNLFFFLIQWFCFYYLFVIYIHLSWILILFCLIFKRDWVKSSLVYLVLYSLFGICTIDSNPPWIRWIVMENKFLEVFIELPLMIFKSFMAMRGFTYISAFFSETKEKSVPLQCDRLFISWTLKDNLFFLSPLIIPLMMILLGFSTMNETIGYLDETIAWIGLLTLLPTLFYHQSFLFRTSSSISSLTFDSVLKKIQYTPKCYIWSGKTD